MHCEVTPAAVVYMLALSFECAVLVLRSNELLIFYHRHLIAKSS